MKQHITFVKLMHIKQKQTKTPVLEQLKENIPQRLKGMFSGKIILEQFCDQYGPFSTERTKNRAFVNYSNSTFYQLPKSQKTL